MKKKIFVSALLAILPLTSCYVDVDPSTTLDNFYSKRRITIEEKNVAVNVGEEKFVHVNAENLGSTVTAKSLVFTSCDPSIATAKYGVFDDEIAEEVFQGMYVTGKSVGCTSIIASYKNAAASVDVNVVDTNDVPYIHLFDTSLVIENGSEYVLPSEILYKETVFDVYENNVIYDFAIIDGEANDIAEFTQDEETGDILINPLKTGSTKVLVSTVFLEKQTTTLLTLEVIDSGVGIIINNEGFVHDIGNNYSTKLYVSDFGDQYKQELDLDVEIYQDDELLEGKTIVLTSDDPEIVSVDGYRLKGNKKGSTFVRGTYDGIDLVIQVFVDKPVIPFNLKSNLLEVDVDCSISLMDSSLIQSEVVGLYYESVDNENVLESYDKTTSKFNIDKNKFHNFVDDYGKEKRFIIETEQIYIETQTIDVYSKVIKTYEDLESWGSIAETYVTEKFNFNGYFILGNNITCPSDGVPVAFDRNKNFKISSIGECVGNVGFNGTFDGRGYTLENYKPKGFGSFITWLTSNGKLRNIAFNNATLDTSIIDASARPVGVLVANGASENGCNVSNIYVKYKQIKTGLDLYKDEYCSTFSAIGLTNLSCSNVFVNAISANINGDFDVLGKMSCDGVYSLGGTHINGISDFGNDAVVGARIFNCSGTFAHFKKSSDMAEHLETYSVISNWDKTYWGNLEGGIPTWNSAK